MYAGEAEKWKSIVHEVEHNCGHDEEISELRVLIRNMADKEQKLKLEKNELELKIIKFRASQRLPTFNSFVTLILLKNGNNIFKYKKLRLCIQYYNILINLIERIFKIVIVKGIKMSSNRKTSTY